MADKGPSGSWLLEVKLVCQDLESAYSISESTEFSALNLVAWRGC